MDTIKEFFGWTTNRGPEGWFSWQHILFCTVCIGLTMALAIVLARKNRTKSVKEKRNPLVWAAIIMWANEILRTVIVSFRCSDPFTFRGLLPFFLCGVSLLAVPFAAWENKLNKIATYFVSVYGMLCCLTGTYLAGNYYGNWPIFSFDVLNSTVSHCGSGFVAVYVLTVGLLDDFDVVRDRVRYYCSPLLILPAVACAIIMNIINAPSDGMYEANYMFLRNSAGTPFSILEELTGYNPVLYAISVVAVYMLYGVVFTLIFRKIKKSGGNR